MHCSFRLRVVFTFLLVAAFVDSVDAFPRRFSRRSSTSYGSGGIKTIAPTADAGSAGYRTLQAYYSYDKGMSEEFAFTDRVRVFMLVRDEQVTKVSEPIVAEVKRTELSKESSQRTGFYPVTFHSAANNYKLAVFDVANEPDTEPMIEPAKVYRLFVNLHRNAETYGRETVIGKIANPYYVATADDTQLGRARQHIAMRTFKEFYFAQHGWPSEENYPMDCYAYYTWATGSCTVGAQNGRAMLGRLFGGRRPYEPGGAISTIAKRGPIHGDYARIPGHHFMLLAYDPATRHVWTMEGNFNSTIKVVIRSVDSSWTIGHLVEEHVNPRLFVASRSAEPGGGSPPPL